MNKKFCDRCGAEILEKGNFFKAKHAHFVMLEEVRIMPKAKKGKWLNHHALWIGHEAIEGWFLQAQCSICKRYADKLNSYCRFIDYEYCPHCGAEMIKG